MKDNRSLLIKGMILGAILALLVFKFAVPKANGPAEITNQVALQTDAIQQNQAASQTNSQPVETAQVEENTETPNNGNQKSESAGTSNEDPKAGQNQQSTKTEEALPIWLLFRSTTCIPCVEMQKTMDALQPEFKGKVEFIPIDVNDRANQELLVKFQIRYIPTTYLYDRNKKLYFQQVGAMSVEDMRSKLQGLVEVK